MKNGSTQAGKRTRDFTSWNYAKTYLVTGLSLRTWGSVTKLNFGRSNSTICPDYQTGLLWYEKQASRRRKRGYVSKDKFNQN